MSELSESWHLSEKQGKEVSKKMSTTVDQDVLLQQLDQDSQQEFTDLLDDTKNNLSQELQEFFGSLNTNEMIALGNQLFAGKTWSEHMQQSSMYSCYLQVLAWNLLGKDVLASYGIDGKQGKVTSLAIIDLQKLIDPRKQYTNYDGHFGPQSFTALTQWGESQQPSQKQIIATRETKKVTPVALDKETHHESLGYQQSDRMLSPTEKAEGFVSLSNERTGTIEQFNGKARYKNPSNPNATKTFDCISFSHHMMKHQFGLSTPLPSEYHNIFSQTCGGKLSGYAEASKSSKDKQDHLHLNNVKIGDFWAPAVMLEHRDTKFIASDDGYINGRFSGNHGGLVSGLIKNPQGEVVDVLITHASSTRHQGPVTVRLLGANHDGYYRTSSKHGRKPQVFARHPGMEQQATA